MNPRILLCVCLSACAINPVMAEHKTLYHLPTNNIDASLYYQIGGGDNIATPAVTSKEVVSLKLKGESGLGFSCGKFNPKATITNALNNFKNSVENVSAAIVKHATTAIVSFPMYKLAQADPNLYNLLNNNTLSAHRQFALKLKSCYVMEQEALRGKNPYSNWIKVAKTQHMKHVIDSGEVDLNNAMAEVNSTDGEKGIPWVKPGKTVGAYAGGAGQAPIMLIADTVKAGYNVMLNRDVTDTSAPNKKPDNAHLLRYWPTPSAAADWLVFVVGDTKITTCTGCAKSSSAGRGLLPYIEAMRNTIKDKLTRLINKQDDFSLANLLLVGAPGQILSPQTLQIIAHMNSNTRPILIRVLSQNIAAARVIDEALLGIKLLRMGSSVPAIRAVGAAKTGINFAIKFLHNEITDIMFAVKIRKQLIADKLVNIMQFNNAQNLAALHIPKTKLPEQTLTHGAIVKS